MSNNHIEVSFYKLLTLPMHKAAPKLIEKIYYTKHNLVVITETEELAKSLDTGLWVYSTKHFIPHGTMLDEHPDKQPVYITTKLENPNMAKISMTLGIVNLKDFKTDKHIYMFDGNIPEQLEFARNKWKEHQKQEHNLTYWQQDIQGIWNKQN